MQNFANKPNKLGGKSSIYDSHSYYMAITGPCNVGRENETVSDRGWKRKGHSPPQPSTLSQPGHTIKYPTPPTIMGEQSEGRITVPAAGKFHFRSNDPANTGAWTPIAMIHI